MVLVGMCMSYIRTLGLETLNGYVRGCCQDSLLECLDQIYLAMSVCRNASSMAFLSKLC